MIQNPQKNPNWHQNLITSVYGHAQPEYNILL